MEYLEIVDWNIEQSYRKDRGTPPWIKIYRKKLTNAIWSQLTDAEKGQFVSLQLVAADTYGVIPADLSTLRKVAQLDNKPNISKFMQLGLLKKHDNQMTTACQPDDNRELNSYPQNDNPEEETGEEEEEEVEVETYKAGEYFEEDWKNYPRKAGNKAKAKSCYLRLVNTAEKRVSFLDKTRRYVSRTDSEYLMYGSTWFRNWVDHIIDDSVKSHYLSSKPATAGSKKLAQIQRLTQDEVPTKILESDL